MNPQDDPGKIRWSLLSRLKSFDDQDSLRTVFDTYWELLYSIGRKCGLSCAEAQDVVEIIVVELTRSFSSGSFRLDPSDGSFKAYLSQLTLRRIRDQVEKRIPRAGGTSFDSQFSSATSTVEKMPDLDSLNWEECWAKGWQKALNEAAFTELSKHNSSQHLQVFQLYAIRGFEPKKVAEMTGVSVEQVNLIKDRLLPKFGEIVKSIEESGHY